MKLIIQIPCYNEADYISDTVADLPQKINGIDIIEYLVIDDGSKDDTVNVARAAGVHHIVSLKKNSGLASAFKAGIDACLELGADIIVNTDADNQYCGADIEKLVRPILENKADIVIGERPIETTQHFSWLKKKLQRLGSWVVRFASNTKIPDAPSGFRAFSREAALRINVVSEYTYTIETIIQAGHKNMAILSVPIRTNEQMRESRLFKSMWQYIERSILTIFRIFMMYKPLKFFMTFGVIFFVIGFLLGARFIVLTYILSRSGSHIQSLLLAVALMIIGVQTIIMAFMADLIACNRKLIETVQYNLRKILYDKNNRHH